MGDAYQPTEGSWDFRVGANPAVVAGRCNCTQAYRCTALGATVCAGLWVLEAETAPKQGTTSLQVSN